MPAPEYRIITIADAFEKIPADRIDAFLEELGAMMKYRKRIEKSVTAFAKSNFRRDLERGYIWIDDDKNDMKFMVD